MSALGPNTNAPPELLSPRCILVAGEDRGDVLGLLQSPSDPSFAFRGYEFWKQSGFTLILSGIGAGCIEPLIWELTRPQIVREIILIGTAGKMPGTSAAVGRVYAVTEAYFAGTGLDAEGLIEPRPPRWDLPAHSATASSVSTDFFYGFSPRMPAGRYPFGHGRLRERYEYHSRLGTQLVEMEVAQFYAFCEYFGDPSLRYVALKGVSNELGNDAGQIAESRAVIATCMVAARQLLKMA